MPITQISISVFDIIGKKVFEEILIATKKANLNLNSLESGTYLIRISDVNGLIETKLLIIY
jgi:ribosome recycling factor